MNLDRVIAVRNNKTVYRDGDRCIKVFQAGYSQSDVFYEVLNQTYAREAGLPVPEILEVSTVEGKWAIVSSYIRGKTLDRLMQEQPQREDEFVQLLVDTQKMIHNASCDKLHWNYDVARGRVTSAQMSEEKRLSLYEVLDQTPRKTQLCHGDLVPSNLIVQNNGEVMVLDWARATKGDAWADVAPTYLHFLFNHQESAAKKYLQVFCSNDAEYLQFQKWLPIGASFRSVVGTEMESEFMSKWL